MKRCNRKNEKSEANLSSVDAENVPGFYGPDDKWLAFEEIVLLTSLQRYSCGNWSRHAENLSTRFNKIFTPEEVRDHFMKTYVEGDISEAMKNIKDIGYESSLKDHTSKEDEEILNSSDINAYKNVPSDFLEQIGYLPLRQEFNEEYASSAEDLLYDLTFKNIDNKSIDEYDKNVNFLVIDAYRHKIKERLSVNKAVKELRLVEQYYAANSPCKKFKNSRFNYKIPENDTFILSKDMNNFYSKTSSNVKNHSMGNSVKESGNLHSKELSQAEAELCSDLDLMPSSYNHYKDFLQKVDHKRVAGELTNELMIPEGMTVAQCLQIVNFMKKAGWIKTKNLLNLHE